MFVVTEAEAAAIRAVYGPRGEFAAAVLEWWWNESSGSQVTTSGTRGAIFRSAVAATRVWSRPCRVKTASSRLGPADAAAPGAGSSERGSR